MIVLYIEDDKYLQEAIKAKFRMQGIDYDLATNGVDGFNKLKAKKYSVIMLDLFMPMMNGFQVLEKIKDEDNLNKETPILVYTNFDNGERTQKAKSLGAKEVIVKAKTTMEEVVAKIREYGEGGEK